MSLPRFAAKHELIGRDANLLLDALESVLTIPDPLQVAQSQSSSIVTSVIGAGGVVVSPVVGDVTVSTVTSGYDSSLAYIARAYTGASRAGPTSVGVISLETIAADPKGELDVNGAWTAKATGYYIVCARISFDSDTTGSSAGYIYKNGSKWRIGRFNHFPYASASCPVFAVGFVSAGDTLTLNGFASPAANIVAGGTETYMEIVRIG